MASRKSRLALWQAEHVQAQLQKLYPDLSIDILALSTEGDRVLDRALYEIGGKGLFTKELEVALLRGEADIAVHSLKDVPMTLAEPFCLAVITEREDARDAWISAKVPRLEDLAQGAVVGTSSLRREAQLKAYRPDLKIQPLRGNLDTRLGKLDKGEFAGILLAAAGLKRLALSERIAQYCDTALMLPAVGQAALAVECLREHSDVIALLQPLNHRPTLLAVSAERELALRLGGSCRVPLAAYASIEGQQMLLRACMQDQHGRLLHAAQAGEVSDLAEAVALGGRVAAKLTEQGALPWPGLQTTPWVNAPSF
ncbi:MAG: hydroxymethylbilane synthase [Betaproteobacteria bacterium]|nr:hydroxymethylbilane synthase [Betaproteobacteria bacterium]